METMWTLLSVCTVTAVMLMSHACGPAEYELGPKECCPMCSPGYYVHKHCTELTSTTCASCPSSSYTETPNGLTSCLSCTVCETAVGLKVKRACSSISDALCEPLEDHYCIDPVNASCQGAVVHTKCSPGQYIKQQGTAYSDTVCDDCGNSTYSDGSFTSCKPHTECQSRGLRVIKKGGSSIDAECGRIVMIKIVIFMLAATVMMLLICIKIRGKGALTEDIPLGMIGGSEEQDPDVQI